jgi:hypothetical protein
MALSPRWRRTALTAHTASSVGWFGAVLVCLVLALAGVRDGAAYAYPAMDVVVRSAVVPLAFASLATGLVSSLGSPWGLLRHYWVVAKLALVVVATAVLLLQLGPVARLAAGTGTAEARMSLVVHTVGGAMVLLAATVLAVWKPRGTTGLGRVTGRAAGTTGPTGPAPGPPTARPTPRTSR